MSLIKALRVLGDPMRLRLLLVMEEEVTVAELQEIFGMGQSRISTHLGHLKRGGLATSRRIGKNVFYRLPIHPLPGLQELLKEARRELIEAEGDQLALALTLKKRKDKAAAYFNQLAGKFGRTYIPGRSWQSLAHALLRLLPPMVIADMGAGEGMLSLLLSRTAKRVIAIDHSEKMVEYGRALAKEHGATNLEYRLGDIEEPPLEPGSVDLVLFSQALHHLPSPQKAIHAAFHSLKPGGKLLILDLASHQFDKARDLYAHVWLGFSEAELYRFLKKAGFTTIEISLVSREKQAPHFRTILATAIRAESSPSLS